VTTIPFPDPPLADEAITLRTWADRDVGPAREATSDAEIVRFTRVPADQTADELRVWLLDRELARKAGETLSLAIADARDDTFLGTISLLRFDWGDRRCEVGYWLAPRGRGRGAATRAVVLLSRWALDELGLARLALCTDSDNAASQAVAERSGFVREGVRRSYEERDGQRYDIVVFSLVPDDLPGRLRTR
jgi:RimJ/RimL family protein N-acetyltransferase